MNKEHLFCSYTPEIHGKLEQYLKEHDGRICTPFFHGIEWFYKLRDKAYFIPGFSAIRLMWNIGREDEHFYIDKNYNLIGATSLPAHRGRPGKHAPEDIITEDGPGFEALHIAKTPKQHQDAQQALREYRKRFPLLPFSG